MTYRTLIYYEVYIYYIIGIAFALPCPNALWILHVGTIRCNNCFCCVSIPLLW